MCTITGWPLGSSCTSTWTRSTPRWSCGAARSCAARRSSSAATRAGSCCRRRTRRVPSACGRGCRRRRPIRLAPNATFLSPDFDSYVRCRKAIVAVFRSVTSVVESASIDEAFLDVTGARGCTAPRSRSGSTCARSSPTSSRSPARSASARPSSWPRSRPGGQAGRAGRGAARRVDRLPAPAAGRGDVGRRGRRPRSKLHRLGIETVGDLAHTPRRRLRPTFGPHAGRDCARWPGAATVAGS